MRPGAKRALRRPMTRRRGSTRSGFGTIRRRRSKPIVAKRWKPLSPAARRRAAPRRISERMTGEHPPATSAGLPTSAPARCEIRDSLAAIGHRGDLLRFRSRVGIVVGLIRRDSRAGRRGRLGLRRRSDLLHRRLSGRDVERRRGRPAVHGQTHADRGVADDRPRSRRPAAGLDGDRDLRPADRLWSARRHARRDDERGRRADRAAPGHADFRAAARRQPPPVERSARSSAACWRPAPRRGRRE